MTEWNEIFTAGDPDPDACWELKIPRFGNAPRVRYEGRFQTAIRVSYLLHHGENAAIVYPWCRNNECIRPEHLRKGAPGQPKDFRPKPEGPVRAKMDTRVKLNRDQVAEIKVHLERGFSLVQVAEHYGVHKATIQAIRNEDSWVYIPPANPEDVDMMPGIPMSGPMTRAKLTARQVAVIKAELLRNKRSGRSLALEYGVLPPAITAIKLGYTWPDVEPVDQSMLPPAPPERVRPAPKPRGGGPARYRLPLAKRLEIWEAQTSGLTQHAVAKQLGVSQGTVSKIWAKEEAPQ